MSNTNRIRGLLMGTALLTLAGCGANDVASPGASTVTINNTTPAPTPTPTPTPTPSVTAANGCPTIADGTLKDDGTITGPVGSFRVCTLPAVIKKSINLPYIKGVAYQLAGRVDVGCDGGAVAPTVGTPYVSTTPTCGTLTADSNATLSIEPGAIVFGGTGVSWLAINRGNKISAVGTATKPIIFTSRDNMLGLNTDSSSGQWGGVVLLGRAQITDCANPAATPGTVGCERQTEGAVDPSLYGGANNADNSGTMSYVQIRYSGYVLSANSELQSLTTEGVGSGTVLDHIQSFNSSDDGAEFFGGHVHMKYFASIGAEDDNLDTDTGLKGNFQYVLVVQRTNIGDAIIEADSDNAVDADKPRQNTRVANATFIDRSPNASSDQASILLRGGTDYGLYNSLLVSPSNPCLRISRTQTASATQDTALDEFGAPIFRSVLMQCAATKYIGSNGVTATDVGTIFGTGANGNNDAWTPSLTSVFINGATETAVTPFDVTTLNGTSFNSIPLTNAGFFAATTYIGAVKDASDTWYQGWTCNSSVVTLGTSLTGLCTSLPVYA